MSPFTLPNESSIVSRLLDSIEALEERLPHEKHPDEPSEAELAQLLSAAFWVSLQQEEGRSVRPALALLPADAASNAFVFQNPLPLTPETLARLGPAIPHNRRAVGLSRVADGGLEIWGTCEPPFNTPLVVVAGPGAVAVRLFGRVLMHFSNGVPVFLDGADASTLLSIVSTSVKDETSFADPFSFSSAFLGLLRSMLEQGHGGTILAVQPGSTTWLDCLSSVRYQPVTPYSSLHETISRREASGQFPFELGKATTTYRLERFLDEEIDAVGVLTAVDGAVVVDFNLNVLGFGAMVKSSATLHATDSCAIIEASATPGRLGTIAELGGSRHRSAADFCDAERTAVAFVASQDGKLTMMGWLLHEGRLFAMRDVHYYLA
jgi:hypothetical protein